MIQDRNYIQQGHTLEGDFGDMSPTQLKYSFILTIEITIFCFGPLQISPTHLKLFVI